MRAHVRGGGEPGVARLAREANVKLRIRRGKVLSGAIGGGVIDKDKLKVAKGLSGKGIQAPGQAGGTIPTHNHDGHSRGSFRRHAPGAPYTQMVPPRAARGNASRRGRKPGANGRTASILTFGEIRGPWMKL